VYVKDGDDEPNVCEPDAITVIGLTVSVSEPHVLTEAALSVSPVYDACQ